MEQLIPWHKRLCEVCNSPFVFRLSRFGCGFSCACRSFIRLHEVLAKYCAELRDGVNHLAFVPRLESADGDDTWQVKIVTLECLCTENAVCATFDNFSEAEVSEVWRALPASLSCQCAVDRRRVWFSLDLLEYFCSELQALCDAAWLPFTFFLNPPSAEVTAVARCRPQKCAQSVSSLLPCSLRGVLHKHQLDGIEQIVALGARVLLADEMGVGKTLQALGAIAVLRAYPVLIICPSALKLMWAEQVEKYLHTQLRVDEICVVHGANDVPTDTFMPKMVITSYQMVARLRQWLMTQRWRCMICDESHALHTSLDGQDALYTNLIIEMARRCRYCLLLSGTPALKQVFDMFNQVDILCPGMLGSTRWQFAVRYCHISFTPYPKLLACARPNEFASLLRRACMVRRTKAEVLELAAKTRVVLRLHDNMPAADDEAGSSANFQDVYAQSWCSKRSGIAEAAMYCVQKYASVVLFAHHTALLDFLHDLLARQHVRHIMIDGRVPVQNRASLLSTFLAGDAVVAVIGITACAIGISLTSASCAVFCELPPDISWMRQAEDRLHRPGQAGHVTIYYLVGLHSMFDAKHLARLSGCFEDVSHAIDGPQHSDTSLNLSHVTRVPPSAPRPASLEMRLPRALPPCTRPLLFLLSRHTGRIHVRDKAGTLYETFSMEEASSCLQQRDSVVWLQLGLYLDSLRQHSSFHRRALVTRALWLPCSYDVRQAIETTGSRMRYRKHDLALGWGLWWRVGRDGGTVVGTDDAPSRFYFASLTRREGVLRPCCLCCGCVIRPPGREEVRVGAILLVESDLMLFCNGGCRRRFFLARSGAALRCGVQAIDRGVCALCHVDCQKLCALVMAAPTRALREEVIRRNHPQMLHFPALLNAFLRRPTPSSLWHADHIIPVAQGGGQADLRNVQTLCVVCHALKTRRERRDGLYAGSRTTRKTNESSSTLYTTIVQTTVECALNNMRSHGSKTRVIRRHAIRCVLKAAAL